MKPPICCVCDKELVDLDEGGLIYFKKRVSDIEWEKRMKEIGGVGHPPMRNGSVRSIIRKLMN